MNLKGIFGAILTVLGAAGLTYASIVFVNSPPQALEVKSLITYGILGLIFFISGIGLVRTTKDEA